MSKRQQNNPKNLITEWGSLFDQQVRQLENELKAIRRHLHAYPEPSGEETETSKFILNQLEKLGLNAWLSRSDTGEEVGVVADVDFGNPPENIPLIAVRCDIDALRIPDEKGVEYSSRNPGTAHACGHDAHATMVLGVAKAVVGAGKDASISDQDLGMRLRLLFQPSEEQSVGARWLVDQGALEGVDAILGLHVDPERTAGQVGIRYGVLTANCDEVEIIIDGHGGHAARPHHSIDPIAAAARLITSFYEILPRSVDTRNPSVFSIGKIVGGYAPNVIPERVELQGTLRTTSAADREKLMEQITRICHGTAEITGVKVTPRFLIPLAAVNNAPHITEMLEEAARNVLGPENVLLIDRPSMGGEDFSVYLEKVPGALMRLGCAVPGEDAPFLHSPLFDIDERCLSIGTRILIQAALLLSQNLTASVKE